MSKSGYDKWRWNCLYDDYDPSTVLYTGEDMQDAYDHGNAYYEKTQDLEEQFEAMRQLCAANQRTNKAEFEEFVNKFSEEYDKAPNQ